MFLYLARHAWAGHYGDPGWSHDSQRPLTPEGIERYQQMVEALVPRGFAPTVIATSPYVRCRQTADIIAEYTGAQVEELEALALGAELGELLEWTYRQHGQDVCWVGHNPDMGHLAAALVSQGYSAVRFAKGAIAAVRFDGDAQPGQGELYWLATAKILGV
ncbi:MAG: SixA phosphatase family protein [Aeoliella sp.]